MQAMPGPSTSPRVLVIVPGVERAGIHRRNGPRDPGDEPRRRHPRHRRRLGRRHRRARGRRRADGVPAALQPRGRRRDAHRLPLRAAARLRRRGPDRRRRPARPALPRRLLGRPRRTPTSSSAPGSRGPATPTRCAALGAGRWCMLAPVLSRLVAHPAHRRHLRLPGLQPRAIAVFATHYPAEYLGDTVESLVIAAAHRLHGARRMPVDMRPGRPASLASPLRAAVYLVPRRRRPGPGPRAATGPRSFEDGRHLGPPSRPPGARAIAPMSARQRPGHRRIGHHPGGPLRDAASPPVAREVRPDLVRDRHRRPGRRAVPGAPERAPHGARPAGAGEPAVLRRLPGAPDAHSPAQLRARPARGAHPHPCRGDRAAAPRARRAATPGRTRHRPSSSRPTRHHPARCRARQTLEVFVPFWGDPELLYATVRERPGADRPGLDDSWSSTTATPTPRSPSTSRPRPTRASATSATTTNLGITENYRALPRPRRRAS